MERNISIDILKIILSVSVVFLHNKFFYDISEKISFLLVNGFFRIAVPTFLIITGYYFYFISTKYKFSKWLSRIVILFLVWNIFYLPIWFKPEIKVLLLNGINGYFVLWYLSGTALAGCILYLLRNLNSHYLLIISFLIYILGCIIQGVGNIHIFSGIFDKLFNFTPLYRNFLFICFPFLTLGFLINKHFEYLKRFKINISFVFLFLGLLITEAYLNYIFISHTEGLDQLFMLFFAVPVLFMYILNLEIKGKTKSLATLSTAIFLIHPLFMFLFRDYIPEQQNTFFSIAVLIASVLTGLFLVRLNQKLKYIL